ncbi:MAG: hypothetical protein HEQ23_12255 [Tepidisphaera sp.]
MLTIVGRSVGSRKPLFADWALPLPPEWASGDGGNGEGGDGEGRGGGGGLTLAGLIERIVRHELAAFSARNERRRLDRVLSADQIEAGLEAGRVSPEGRQGLNKAPEAEEAVAAALQAFEDGLYLVVIDEMEHRDLDAQVWLTADSTIVFLKLTFLAGG